MKPRSGPANLLPSTDLLKKSERAKRIVKKSDVRASKHHKPGEQPGHPGKNHKVLGE